MLVLNRKAGEQAIIGDTICVTVVAVRGEGAICFADRQRDLYFYRPIPAVRRSSLLDDTRKAGGGCVSPSQFEPMPSTEMTELFIETATDLVEVAEFNEQEVWCRESLSCIGEADRIVQAVREAMTNAGYATKDVFGVRLALEEALVNALRHGHRRDPTKKVRIRYQVTTQRVVIVIKDQGPGFDRDRIPDPTAPKNLDRSSGRGLLLMRHYMTGMRHNKRGNRVILWKCRHC